MPITSCPCSLSSAAAAEESTPPLMALADLGAPALAVGPGGAVCLEEIEEWLEERLAQSRDEAAERAVRPAGVLVQEVLADHRSDCFDHPGGVFEALEDLGDQQLSEAIVLGKAKSAGRRLGGPRFGDVVQEGCQANVERSRRQRGRCHCMLEHVAGV